MTLYKIFKENKNRIHKAFGCAVYDKNKIYPIHPEILNDVEELDKQSQLALIDGVTTETEETYKVNIDSAYDTEKPMYVRRNHATNNEDYVRGYNKALSDLKDKLLADRKLIEEND